MTAVMAMMMHDDAITVIIIIFHHHHYHTPITIFSNLPSPAVYHHQV